MTGPGEKMEIEVTILSQEAYHFDDESGKAVKGFTTYAQLGVGGTPFKVSCKKAHVPGEVLPVCVSFKPSSKGIFAKFEVIE